MKQAFRRTPGSLLPSRFSASHSPVRGGVPRPFLPVPNVWSLTRWMSVSALFIAISSLPEGAPWSDPRFVSCATIFPGPTSSRLTSAEPFRSRRSRLGVRRLAAAFDTTPVSPGAEPARARAHLRRLRRVVGRLDRRRKQACALQSALRAQTGPEVVCRLHPVAPQPPNIPLAAKPLWSAAACRRLRGDACSSRTGTEAPCRSSHAPPARCRSLGSKA
jgi:hypothetical protein